jgi:hypothetical protein
VATLRSMMNGAQTIVGRLGRVVIDDAKNLTP